MATPSQLYKIHQIELINFKSYHGHIIIGPFLDYSCIVGSNGSGKSNIMDALSFVFGSSATALRGQKPTDFINRNSVGSGIKECSVTLVMRHNGKDIKLTRSVDSKGQIGVAINSISRNETEFAHALRQLRIPVRTNTYLVFQHEVEVVAQRKAHELTDLVEQISGSAEMKDAYARSRRALEQATEALANASIEKRGAVAELAQMRLHKKEADRFNEVQSRLIEERRNLAMTELFHLEVFLQKQKKEFSEAERAAKEMELSIASEDTVRKMKSKYAEKHKKYLELLKNQRQATHAARDARQMLERVKVSIEYFKRRVEQLTTEYNTAKNSSLSRSQETSRLEALLKQQQTLLASFDAQCATEDKKHQAADAAHCKLTQQQLEEYRLLKREANCQTITKRQELETVCRQHESFSEALKQVTLTIENNIASKKEMQAHIARNKERVAEVLQRKVEAERTLEDLKIALKSAKETLHHVQLSEKKREEELADVESQLHELRHFKEDNKASLRASEALKSLQAMHSGVRGRLVNLCTISQDHYRNAVTVAMGRNLEAVVVDTTETALACVRYLKEQRLSPMTFIPLSNAQGKEVDDNLRTFGGTCKPVVDVIKYDLAIEAAVRYAIGQTLVCESIEEAKRIAYDQKDGTRHKVCTWDGTVLLKNGSIQGGLTAVASRSKKWDEKKYDDLKEKRDHLLAAPATTLSAVARSAVEVRDLEARMESCQKRIANTTGDVAILESQAKTFEVSVQRIDEQLVEMRRKKEHFEQQLTKCDEELKQIDTIISKKENEVFKDFQAKVGITDMAELERKETLQVRIRAEKRRQYLVVIENLKLSIEAEQKRVGSRDLSSVEEALKKAQSELQRNSLELHTVQKHLDDVQSRGDAATQAASKAKGELDTLEQEIRRISRNSEFEVHKLVALKKNIAIQNAACNTLRLQRMSLYQRCRMEEIDLPVANPDKVGTKRMRRESTNHQMQSGREGVEDTLVEDGIEEIDAEELNASEAFMSYTEATASEISGRPSGSDMAASVPKQKKIVIDFRALDAEFRNEAKDRAHFVAYKRKAESLIDELERELDSIAPNLKAGSKFSSSEQKLGKSGAQLEAARENQRIALLEFTKVKDKRTSLFNATFEKLVAKVDQVYRDLTMSTRANNVHGSAYLTVDDVEEPYNGGTKYHVVPPMKRFMGIEALSGGERTMAALALLFAVHAISSSPFFVLDEVDAALDTSNVQKLSHYLQAHKRECQYIVVSLKEQLYHTAEALYGVYIDKARQSSGVVTLKLDQYAN